MSLGLIPTAAPHEAAWETTLHPPNKTPQQRDESLCCGVATSSDLHGLQAAIAKRQALAL